MTKIKNTKKSMAKKTLSMSLVVAMLATSNVPVWAAEFSDGSDAAAVTSETAPAIDETTTFADEAEAPTVEDSTVDTAAATAVSVDAKIKESGWKTAATVDLKGFTAGALASTDKINYIWKVNGLEVASGTVAATATDLKALTYTPAKGDCGGELQLSLSYTDPDNEDSDKNFTWESNKVTVSKHDISKDNITVTMKSAGPIYDGKNHNDASEWVSNYEALVNAGYDVSVITDKDFVNADSHITAKVTPKDTAYYQGEVTSATAASIAKSAATDKLKVEYVGSGYTYTGSEIALKASDFKLTDTLSGEVLDSSKYIDLSKSSNAKATNAGEYEATIKTKDLVNYTIGAQDVKAGNKWKIAKADLSKCTVFLGEISEKTTPVLASDLTKITISDGTHTLCDGTIPADFVIGNVQANTGSVGTYTATVQTKADSANFTGTTTAATFRVVRNALSNAEFEGTTSNPNYAKADENYTGEAITKDTKKLGSLVILQNGKKVKLTAGIDYDATFEYSNNTNAGQASFTVTGKGSFEGSKLVVPFTIKAAHVTNKDDMVSDKVGFVEDSTRKASDYKSGITVNVKAENDAKKAFTLVEGTDYKVDYSYENEKLGNDKNNKIVVKITLLNNNFGKKGTEYSEVVALTKKQISSVTVTPVQSSYTYTGAAIVPELIVKDGETELSKGEDYVVKSVSNNKNVGTATIVIAGATNSDYDVDSTAKATFTITPANASDLVVNVDDQSYDGTKKKPAPASIKLNGVPITDKFIASYPTSAQANRQVGTGTLTLTPDNGNKNFTGTKEVSFNIVGKKLSVPDDALQIYKADGTKVTNTTFTYDGTAHTFAKAVATIIDGSKKLVEGTDYEIKYFHNVSGTGDGATGTAYVAVVGKGNYAGNGSYNITDENGKTVNCIVNKKFTINRLQLVKQCVTIKDAEYAEGLPVKPQVTVTYGGNVLTEGTDYKLDIPTVTTITSKTYKAVVTGKNGYYGIIGSLNTSDLTWKVTKKDLTNCDVTATKDASGALSVTVMNGSVKVPAEKYVAKENADGTVTVTPAKDSKYYTGSKTVALVGDKTKVGTPVISSVKVVGNKATVILSGEADGASGYDYVISTDRDCIKNKNYDSISKNQVQTSTTFKYVQQGTYYAYCHAWKRDENGKKVFGEWSNAYPFSVTAITPDAPVITNVTVSGSTIKVTYKAATNATGYDVVLGTSSKKENGETRPYQYGNHKKLNLKEGTVTATFKNVPKGTWVVGMHAFNRTSEDGKKVFSPWSNLKKATVK